MPEPASSLLALLAPLSLGFAALIGHLGRGPNPATTLRVSALATHVAFACSLLVALGVATHGPLTATVLDATTSTLSLRLDAVSVTLFALIAFVGVIVVRFSRNYLAGDPRQALFTGRLCLTLAAVLSLVLAGNVVQLTFAWIATSLTLHHLLVFYPERPRARLAARKKFWVARAGDVCLVAAASLLVNAFDTTDIARLNAAARAHLTAGTLPVSAQGAALLLAVAALLKSAQFPTHGWLTEVMETPTPVSALLHAGIVNAGGFLVVRFADVMLATPAALLLLAAVGAVTALYGSAVMLAQPAVKTALAYSTVAQMGFMLFECGLGAWSVALLHIVAHSLYKAHAFLSAGSAVQSIQVSRLFATPAQHTSARAMGLGLVGVLGLSLAFALLYPQHAVVVGLGAIVAVGATTLALRPTAHGTGGGLLWARGALEVGGIVGLYLALEHGVTWLVGSTLPEASELSTASLMLLAATVASFAALAMAQQRVLQGQQGPWLQRAYVHLRHGLYANVLFDRVLGEQAPNTSSTTSTLTLETQA